MARESAVKPNDSKIAGEGGQLTREWEEQLARLFRKVDELETRIAALEP
ncbi:MAG: hypothetical protein GY952_06775 [Rhodobacteraceae bacterium]|nr:hypothetical protein [Paracoccaceae bacterium]